MSLTWRNKKYLATNFAIATRETELLVLPMNASTQAGSGFLAMANPLGVFT
jgi:hypothetical protein